MIVIRKNILHDVVLSKTEKHENKFWDTNEKDPFGFFLTTMESNYKL